MKSGKTTAIRFAAVLLIMVGGTFVKDIFKIGIKDGAQQKAKIASHQK
ncbi:hypothetical protein [Pedobacter duraquae]|nr:hypothetical protein [Pedobacter duraquae]